MSIANRRGTNSTHSSRSDTTPEEQHQSNQASHSQASRKRSNPKNVKAGQSNIKLQTSPEKYSPKKTNNDQQLQRVQISFGKGASSLFFIDQPNRINPIAFANRLLQKIQLIQYSEIQFAILQRQFKKIMKDHIKFEEIFPKSSSKVGKQLISNGLFHEMWGIILKKDNKTKQFSNYYQKYYAKLTSNHSNFEKMFNQYDSKESLSENLKSIDEDSNTRLTKKATTRKVQFTPESSINQSSKENVQIKIQHKSGKTKDERLRLTEIQTNKRRLNAEIVCYFLGITKCFNLIDLSIDKILQFYHHENKELLILHAHLQEYNDKIKKEVVDYRPSVLIAMYGYVSLPQLLRIKKQYEPIAGFILYDQLISISIWLRKNGFLYNET